MTWLFWIDQALSVLEALIIAGLGIFFCYHFFNLCARVEDIHKTLYERRDKRRKH